MSVEGSGANDCKCNGFKSNQLKKMKEKVLGNPSRGLNKQIIFLEDKTKRFEYET